MLFKYVKLDDISLESVAGEAFLFLLAGFFLYANYIVGKVASNNNKINGIIHVIKVAVFCFIAAVVVPFSILSQIRDLAKFLPSLSLAGLLVGLTSAFFTRKSTS